jgi:hypothetical protein
MHLVPFGSTPDYKVKSFLKTFLIISIPDRKEKRSDVNPPFWGGVTILADFGPSSLILYVGPSEKAFVY